MKSWKNYHKMKLIVQIKNSSNMSLNDQLTVVYNVAIWRTQPNKFPPKNVFNSSDKFLMSSLKNNFSSSFEGTNNSAHTKFLIIIWKKTIFVITERKTISYTCVKSFRCLFQMLLINVSQLLFFVFFYAQLTFVFYLQRNFSIACFHTIAFFSETFFVVFLCYYLADETGDIFYMCEKMKKKL